VDDARDRKALLSHKLARLKEGRQWLADRGSDLSEYERNYGDEIRALEAELAQVEVVLQTPGLETAYWWARGVDDGLDNCEVLKPSIELVLKYWRGGHMVLGVTADALFEEIFNTND